MVFLAVIFLAVLFLKIGDLSALERAVTDLPEKTKTGLSNFKIPEFNNRQGDEKNKNITKTHQGSYIEGEVLIKFKDDKIDLKKTKGTAKLEKFSEGKNIEKKNKLENENISLFKIKDKKTVREKISELKNDPNIEYIQPNYKKYPTTISTNDTYRNNLWALDNTGQSVNGTSGTSDKDIDAPEAWAISEGSENTAIVAIIDDGVQYGHPDLLSNMWDGSSCKDENGDYLGGCNYGYDFEEDDKTPLPIGSHGTHIAGIIGAVKNNNKGVIGTAPNVEIMALKYPFTTFGEIQAINFAEQNGAKVINASFTGLFFDQAEKDAIDAYNGLFIAAAGNDSTNNEITPSYPCSYNSANIICVAATDQDDDLAAFSNYGVTSVDVGAPGTNIQSTIAGSSIILNETFESVTPPNIPASWTETDNWGTYSLGGWGNVLYGDVNNIPYAQSANSTVTSSTYNLSGSDGTKIDFWTKCDTEYSTSAWTDYIALEVSSNGSNFTEFFKWDEYALDYWNGDPEDESGGAIYYFEDILIPSQYYTSNFKFRLRWVANGNSDTGGGDGCLVDDIFIESYQNGSEEYGYMQGTSMATPYVAGLAGLLLGYDNSLTNSEVKAAIIDNGDPLSALNGKTVSGKRINAYNALDSLSGSTPDTIPIYALLDKTSDSYFYTTSLVRYNYYLPSKKWFDVGTIWEGFATQEPNTVPVYRMRNKVYRFNFYTTDVVQRDRLDGRPGWQYVGIAWYVYGTQQPNTVPVYHLHNKKERNHFMTSSPGQKTCMDRKPNWYIYKNPAFWVPEEGANLSTNTNSCTF